MGRREGRFPGAPGRAAREARRAAERVPAAALPATLSCPGLEAARGVERGIRAFRNLAKEHDGQDDEECFGFSDLDVSASVERADLLRSESDNLKHDLAKARALQVGCST